MRVATLSRADLGKRHMRLDPAFYVGRQRVRSTVNAEGSQLVRLRDIVVSIHDGSRLPAIELGIPMLRLNDLRPCELDLSSLTHVDGSAAKWVNVRDGDVVFTRAARPFRAAAALTGIPDELAVSSELTVIRPQPAVLPEYLAAVLCTPTLNRILRDLAYRGRSSALPRLHLSDIQRLPIALPPRSLQESLRAQYREAVDLTAQARTEINAVATAIHTEIDHRLAKVESPGKVTEVRRAGLPSRWDVPLQPWRYSSPCARLRCKRPITDGLAKPVATSLRGLEAEDEVLTIQADGVNERTFLVEEAEFRPLDELSTRMRQRIQVGVVLMCTTGAGDQVAYLDEEVGHGGQPIIASATFTALRFSETPRVFAVTLSHPLIRQQLRLLSSGSVQRFVNKRDLDELLVPVLGQVWREDFETRLTRAMHRRREALIARAALIDAADGYLQEVMP